MPMTLFRRDAPRRPVPWPYDMTREVPMFGTIVAGLATVALFLGVTGYQGSCYYAAGVRDVFWVGAAAGHLIVLVLMLAAATLYRWGYSRRLVTAAGVAAALAGLVFAILPPVVAGRGWLTCVLAALLAATLYLAFAGWVALAARYLPMWWSGWALRPAAGEVAE
jgi:hypothetical protein